MTLYMFNSYLQICRANPDPQPPRPLSYHDWTLHLPRKQDSQQKKDVDLYFRTMPDCKDWWIKVDVIKGSETDSPRFRVGRKSDGNKWDKKWFIDIKEPSI